MSVQAREGLPPYQGDGNVKLRKRLIWTPTGETLLPVGPIEQWHWERHPLVKVEWY